MKPVLFCGLAAFALAGCAAMSPEPAGSRGSKEAKIAFDITNGNPHAVILQLTVVDLTRKQLIEAGVTPRIVLAFRGDASYFTQTNLGMVKEADRADALQIQSRLRDLKKANGVEALEQCNVPLASRKLKPTDLMQEVMLVPNGWISLAEYQHKGYSYIVP